MTVRSARTAAAIVLALGFSSIVASAPAVAETGSSLPASVTIVAALTAPERKTGFIDSELLASYTSDFGLLTRELDQVINRPVALGIDPMVIASIRVLGKSAPPTAIAWLDRLASASNETFPLAWADSDLTIGLQAGSREILAPTGFDYAIDPAQFSAAPDVDPTSTPTPLPTEDPTIPPPLPTAESLVAWNYTVPSLAWPAMNSVTGDDLVRLGASYETTLLSSGNVADFASTAASATIGDTRTIVSNEAISTLFSTTVGAGAGAAWETAVASLRASLGSIPSVGSGASVLIALDRAVPMSDTDLGATIDAVATDGSVRMTSLADLVAVPGAAAKLTDEQQPEARITSVHALLAQEALDREFAQIAENPALITQQLRLDLLATLSNGWRNNSIGWTAAVGDYISASTTLRSQVNIVKSSTVTLWADRASFPVTIANGLDQSITVYVTVRPLSPLLKVENSFVEVTVEPKSQRKAQVPVQAISNGEVELEVSLHGTSGTAVGATKYVRTTVQAGWETPFTVGLGVLVVLVFVLGIIRTILRRRKAREEHAE